MTASAPLRTTHPDSTRWKPSEIPSQTRSVSASRSVGPRSSGKVGREASQPLVAHKVGVKQYVTKLIFSMDRN